MKHIFIATFFAVLSLQVFALTFQFSHLWTGDDNQSSSPTPHCVCDIDMNRSDCLGSFEASDEGYEICYDEFIPVGSRGWANARVFRVVNH